MKNAYRRNIKLEYLFTFVKNFNLTNAFWLIYLAFKGLTLFQIGIVEAIFHLTSFTMEIPTGAIADLYGRKVSRLIGLLLYIGYITILVLSDNFYLIAIAFVLCGLSYTLESGAGDALVYDSLLETGNEDDYKGVQANKEILFQVASIISTIVAGYVALHDYDLIFKIMILITIAAFLVVVRMKETTLHEQGEKVIKKFKHQYIDSLSYIWHRKNLLLLIIIVSLFTFPVTTLFFYAQNYFISKGFNEFEIALILGLHSLGSVLGAYYISRREHDDRTLFIIFPLIQIILLWLFITEYGFIALILLGPIDSILYVVFSDYINKLVPSTKRATILSVSGMLFSFLMILVFPLIGYIAEHYGFIVGFTWNASLLTVAFIIYILFYRSLNNVEGTTAK